MMFNINIKNLKYDIVQDLRQTINNDDAVKDIVRVSDTKYMIVLQDLTVIHAKKTTVWRMWWKFEYLGKEYDTFWAPALNKFRIAIKAV